MNNIYDITFANLGGGMYRSWVGIDLEEGQTPTHRPAALDNWHPDDLESYVGGPYFPRNN